MQAYGLVTSTFADVSYTDIEPVGYDFIGVKYYIAEEVDRKDDTAFFIRQIDSRQETIDELFLILKYWKDRCAELKKV